MTRIEPQPSPARPDFQQRTVVAAAPSDALAAIVFERLLSRYEKRFGAPPPIRAGDVDEVNRLMRRDLGFAEGDAPAH